MSSVDFALHTAQQGYSVFPLAPNDKVPAIPKEQGGRGYLDATRDPQQIERWWDRYPEANIGIETGGTLLVPYELQVRRAIEQGAVNLMAKR